MKYRLNLALAIITCGTLGGCKFGSEHAKAPAQVRPVLTVVVKTAAEQHNGFAGTIQPQYQTERGFQVLGRIISRDVEVGDIVKAGQTLATLDPLVFDLAVRSSEADLARAKAELSNASAAEQRRNTLLNKKVVSQAEYDTAEQARAAAAASEQQAAANLDKAREQRTYTKLTAAIDGVVTSTDAEPGQTVAAGKTIMTVARLDIREAVVDLPEDVARAVPIGAGFAVKLQADMSITTTGKVREIAPQADAATRTRRIKITLDHLLDAFRLGATITATPIADVTEIGFEIPRSALLKRDGETRVWLVDPAEKAVKTVAVEVATGDDIQTARVTSGLAQGARVVIAGVNSLTEGQAVKIDEGMPQ